MIELILIEDFAPLRRILTQALRDAGFNVTSFEDGSISDDPSVMKQADLVITDIEMPSVDGHEVIENIKSSMPDLQTIVISGTSDENLEGVEAASVLRKPFEPEDLVRTVETILTVRSKAETV